MKKVLVSGATGFIGNYVIEKLLSYKDISVMATSRDEQKAFTSKWFGKVKYSAYRISGMPNRNLYEFFEKPDCLIHLAWDSLGNYSDVSHIDQYLFDHYYFLKNLIENGLKNYTIVGTCMEYGLIDGCLREDMATNPVTAYGLAKDILRKMIEFNFSGQGQSFKWARLFYVFGEGKRKNSLLELVNIALQKGETTFPMSGGEQLRDYMYVEELAEELVRIALQDQIHGIFNCCSGKPISIRKLVENYLRQQKSTIELILGKHHYPTYEPMAFWGDTTKLRHIKANTHD